MGRSKFLSGLLLCAFTKPDWMVMQSAMLENIASRQNVCAASYFWDRDQAKGVFD